MKRLYLALISTAALAGFPAVAQNAAPELTYNSTPNPLTMPDDIYLGEVGGVATNAQGELFVYTRTDHPTVSLGGSRSFAHGGSRLFRFDRNGRYESEIGQGIYGFMFAAQTRVDPQNNLWVVDQASGMVIKFDPTGRNVLLLLGRKPEAIPIPARAGGGGGEGGGGAAGAPGAGRQQDVFDRPTDVAWDSAGDIFVADGLGNARIAKFDKDGKFIKSWGQKGAAPGQFANVRSIAVDAQGNVYAADGGNHRIQVFDNNGTFKTEYDNLGNPQALCLTSGANPVLYVSDSNPPNNIDTAGEIYKMTLDGRIMGKFGHAGKQLGEFGTVNAIDCRNPNQLYVGEVGNLRVQKITLR